MSLLCATLSWVGSVPGGVYSSRKLVPAPSEPRVSAHFPHHAALWVLKGLVTE